MNKKPLSIRIILLWAVSALTLLIGLFAIYEVHTGWQKLEKIHTLKKALFLSERLFEMVEKLSAERDVSFSALYAKDEAMLKRLRPQLEQSRQEVDKMHTVISDTIKIYDFKDVLALYQKNEEQFKKFKALRKEVDQALTLAMAKRNPLLPDLWLIQVTELTAHTQDLWMEFTKHFTAIDPIITQRVMFKHFLGVIIEKAGRERALIGKLIAENSNITAIEQGKLLQWRGMVEQSWYICNKLAARSRLSPTIDPYLKDAESHYWNLYTMVRDSFYAPGAKRGAVYPISLDFWLELATQATDSLYALKDKAVIETNQYLQKLEAEADRIIAVHIIALFLAMGLCAYIFLMINRRVVRPINNMVDALVNAMEGKPVSINIPSQNQQDEISKLAHVLHAFQESNEAIKRTSLQLARYAQDLERSNKELDDFAYIASHDLKEPLRWIHNHSRFLLEDNEKKLDAESVGRLHRLTYLSQRMEKLVNDLLYFSRIGRQELAVCETDMNSVIHDIESTLDVLLSEHHARIIIPTPLPVITCDQTRITEVFRNLIVNAIKYNDKEEKIIEIGFLEKSSSRSNVFYVKDNGIGIAPEFHQEVFRIFKRLHSTKNKEEEGTGVGLTFVKKIIERHGGKIWLESEPGKGTVFYFTLQEKRHDPST